MSFEGETHSLFSKWVRTVVYPYREKKKKRKKQKESDPLFVLKSKINSKPKLH